MPCHYVTVDLKRDQATPGGGGFSGAYFIKPGKNKVVGRCGMALHLMTSPSRRLLLKGVLKCLTLRSVARLITQWEVRGGERAAILPCAAAASSLLHGIGPIAG